jgi:hypothetical protein
MSSLKREIKHFHWVKGSLLTVITEQVISQENTVLGYPTTTKIYELILTQFFRNLCFLLQPNYKFFEEQTEFYSFLYALIHLSVYKLLYRYLYFTDSMQSFSKYFLDPCHVPVSGSSMEMEGWTFLWLKNKCQAHNRHKWMSERVSEWFCTTELKEKYQEQWNNHLSYLKPKVVMVKKMLAWQNVCSS